MANMVNNLDTNEDITFDKLSLKDYTDNLTAFLESSENEISDKIILALNFSLSTILHNWELLIQ